MISILRRTVCRGNKVLQLDDCSSTAMGKLAVSHWEAVCGVFNHNTAWAKIPAVPYGQLPAPVTLSRWLLVPCFVLSVIWVGQASPIAPGAMGWHTLSNVSHLLQGGQPVGLWQGPSLIWRGCNLCYWKIKEGVKIPRHSSELIR